MKNIFPTFVFACCWTVAQSTPPASQPTEEKKPAAIRGIVRDQTSGNPIADVRMTLSGSLSGSVETSTDGQGHFAFNELRPGQYEVVAQVMFKGTHHPYGPHVTRHVDVQPGQTLESFDLRMPTYGKISGKVVDQNGEPVANVGVSLIARVYSLGALRYRYFQQERTDDRGMYSFSSVPPRQSYLIYANSRKQILDAASQIPVDPKLRKRAIVPTFYPFSGTLEGAAPITLSPGESREAVDIILARTPSYCMESKVPADLPQGTSFSVAETQPAFGFVGDSGILGMNPGGTIPADHKLRICDLHPGEYQFELMRASSDPHVPAYYSATNFSVHDHDVTVPAPTVQGAVTVGGELVWDGVAATSPSNARVLLWIMPMSRPSIADDETRVEPNPMSIPGGFTMPGLLPDNYVLKVLGIPAPYYLKDVLYGTASFLHAPFHPEMTLGKSELRIVIGTDGGTANAKVQDNDGSPLADAYVVLMPASAVTEAALADSVISGQTDQRGAYSTGPIAPGKYYTLAAREPFGTTPEAIARLTQARTRAQEVEIGPKTTVTLTFTLKGE